MTKYDKSEVCGICKKEISYREGFTYYAGDEWLNFRLFICNECHKDIAVQRTHHEQCFECIESYDKDYTGTGLIESLWEWRDHFEKAHKKIFDKLPPTTEKNEVQYPGSLSRNFEKWLKEKFPKEETNSDEL